MSTDVGVTPDLVIEQYRDRVVVEGAGFPQCEMQLIPELMARYMTRFAESVEAARPRGLPTSDTEAQQFLSFLKFQTFLLLSECIRDEIDWLQEVWGRICNRIQWALELQQPLFVEIRCHTADFLPWECVGALDQSQDWQSEAESTIGFSCLAYRRGIRREFGKESILSSAPLRVRFFRDPGLPGTQREWKYFRNKKDLALIGPLPETAPGGELQLGWHLANPNPADLTDIAGSTGRGCPVFHLSCHHHSSVDFARATALELYGADSVLCFGLEEKHKVKRGDLHAELLRQRRAAPEGRPPVFFNACSGDFHPYMASSLSDLLLRNGNRGVVSTALKVPDEVAAVMTRLFYDALLAGESWASSLAMARRSLLQRHRYRSPLGILYTYHGPPDLRLGAVAEILSS